MTAPAPVLDFFAELKAQQNKRHNFLNRPTVRPIVPKQIPAWSRLVTKNGGLVSPEHFTKNVAGSTYTTLDSAGFTNLINEHIEKRAKLNAVSIGRATVDSLMTENARTFLRIMGKPESEVLQTIVTKEESRKSRNRASKLYAMGRKTLKSGATRRVKMNGNGDSVVENLTHATRTIGGLKSRRCVVSKLYRALRGATVESVSVTLQAERGAKTTSTRYAARVPVTAFGNDHESACLRAFADSLLATDLKAYADSLVPMQETKARQAERKAKRKAQRNAKTVKNDATQSDHYKPNEKESLTMTPRNTLTLNENGKLQTVLTTPHSKERANKRNRELTATATQARLNDQNDSALKKAALTVLRDPKESAWNKSEAAEKLKEINRRDLVRVGRQTSNRRTGQTIITYTERAKKTGDLTAYGGPRPTPSFGKKRG